MLTGQLSILDVIAADDLAAAEVPLGWTGYTVPPLEQVTRQWDRWELEHGNFNSAHEHHAWRLSSIDSLPDVLSGHSCEVYTAWLGCALKEGHGWTRCSCVGDGVQTAVCRPCGWQGPVTGQRDEGVPAWLDHAWPGWRDLPVSPRQPEPGTSAAQRKATAAWHTACADLVDPKWQRPGAPFLTDRGEWATRSVPGRSPWGGYDVAVQVARPVHVLMPCMAYACGPVLERPGRGIVGTSRWDEATCPECIAPGRAAIAAECARQQGRQA